MSLGNRSGVNWMRVTVQSTLGEGTTFVVRLPARDPLEGRP